MHDLAPRNAARTVTPGRAGSRRSLAAKRVFDVVVASALLVVLSPVLLTVALAILVTMGRPVLFVQRRPGLHAELFPMLKFRTMTLAPEGTGTELDAERTTRLGRLLRSTSVDELPELINVVRGHMSLVGPRPLLAGYLELYTPTQARRHEVRPGVTGLAQTTGRKGLTWEETFELDVWYVDNADLALDLRVLARTARVVLSHITRNADEDLGRLDFGATQDPEVVVLPPVSPPGDRGPDGEDALRVLTEEELVAWKRARGLHVIERHGRYWERHHGGFYQPPHLLERLPREAIERPTWSAWGYRAALTEEDAAQANASIPVRLMHDVDAFDVSTLSSSRRNQLRRCRKRADIQVLTDADVLRRSGAEIVRSCAERIGFAAPTDRGYREELARYLEGGPLVLLAATLEGQPVGYLTAYAVGQTAYVDRVFVHTDALNTYASVGLLHDVILACQATPGVREIVHGQDRRENPSLGRFKEGMGFGLIGVPSYVHLAGPAAGVIARRRPHAFHRLTGRT